MTCPKCGAPVTPDEKHRFCGVCGTPLETGTEKPANAEKPAKPEPNRSEPLPASEAAPEENASPARRRNEAQMIEEDTKTFRPPRRRNVSSGTRHGSNGDFVHAADRAAENRRHADRPRNPERVHGGEPHGNAGAGGVSNRRSAAPYRDSRPHHREAPYRGDPGGRGSRRGGRSTARQENERGFFMLRLAKTALLSAISITLVLLLIIGLFSDPITSLSVSWFRPQNGKITAPLQILGIAERNLFQMRSFDFELTYEGTTINGTVEWGSSILTSKAAIHIEQSDKTTVVYYNNEKVIILENHDHVSGFSMRKLLSTLTNPEPDDFFTDMIRLFEEKGVDRAYPDWTREQKRLADTFVMLYDLVEGSRLDRKTLFNIADNAALFVFPMLVHNSPYTKKHSYTSETQIPNFQNLLDFTTDFLSNHVSKQALTAKRSGAGSNINYNITLDPGALSKDLLEYMDRDAYFQAFCDAYGASSTTILKKMDFRNIRERFAENPIHIQTIVRHGFIDTITASANGINIMRFTLTNRNKAHVNEKDYANLDLETLKNTKGITDEYMDDPYNTIMYYLRTHIKEVSAQP